MDIEKFFNIPEGYQQMKPLENDPEGCVNIGRVTEAAQCFVQLFPIAADKAMRADRPQEVIDSLHEAVAEHQALIEVENGQTTAGRPYIYSIVKTKVEPAGVQYFLLLQVTFGPEVFNVQGFFTEDGMTGMRDAKIWSKCRQEGVISMEDPSQWFFDPYDKNLKRAFLMNRSELSVYDEEFPEHPLTLCRQFVAQLRNML